MSKGYFFLERWVITLAICLFLFGRREQGREEYAIKKKKNKLKYISQATEAKFENDPTSVK